MEVIISSLLTARGLFSGATSTQLWRCKGINEGRENLMPKKIGSSLYVREERTGFGQLDLCVIRKD